jgi:hypothetical protein
MWSELVHRIVWYIMVMNILEEHAGSVNTVHHDGSIRSRPHRLC